MNKLQKITKIDSTCFNNFDGSTLHDFKRYNLMFGYNGTGKTTLSNLLGNLTFFYPNKINVQPAPTALFRIKVFNRDYVKKNLCFETDDFVRPFLILGEENIETQQKLKLLEGSKKQWEKEKDQISAKLTKIENDFKGFKTNKAKLVYEVCKEARNYDARSYVTNLKEMNSCYLEPLSLEEIEKRKNILNSPQKSQINWELSKEKLERLNSLPEEIKHIFARSLTNSIVIRLRSDTELETWVQKGLHLHEDKETCQFCNQTLPLNLLETYTQHFNDEYRTLQSDCKTLIEECKSLQSYFEAKIRDQAIAKSAFHPSLQEQFQIQFNTLQDWLDAYSEISQTIIQALDAKNNNPSLMLSLEQTAFPTGYFQPFLALIKEHNRLCENHEQEIQKAKEELKKDLLSQDSREYFEYKSTIESLQDSLNTWDSWLKELESEVDTLQKEAYLHKPAVEELNKILKAYLNTTELEFNSEGGDFGISRNQESISGEDLSEGEKTSIALCYFLTSLQEQDFNITESIIIIDDPVSSLDSSNMLTAFAYLKEKLKDSAQLFFLTHNFTFFNLVKNWFVRLKEVSYYRIIKKANSSVIVDFGKELLKYSSEYMINFEHMYKAYQNLDDLLFSPQTLNMTRKVLEQFLFFHSPDQEFAENPSLYNLLKGLSLTQEEKILVDRLANSKSHLFIFTDYENVELMQETEKVLQIVIKLMKEMNLTHFENMLKALKLEESPTPC